MARKSSSSDIMEAHLPPSTLLSIATKPVKRFSVA
jgi:hypothetical protein